MNTFLIVLINDIIILCLYGLYLFLKSKKEGREAEDKIISMVNESQNQGYIEENEAKMINNIFEIGDKQAKDIMTDRSNIVAIDASLKLTDAVELMLNGSNSRFPVYSGDLDHIVGILHMKDAIRMYRIKGNATKHLDSFDDLLRDAHFIPETRKLDSLFQKMQAQKLQMVVIVDEYGQTAGIVAMEDILEEIVGNIQDEYDEDDTNIVCHGDKYIISGVTTLDELEKQLNIKFEETDFETINGFLISKMEKIPDKKEKFDITFKGYNFKVLEVDHNMVTQVLVTKVAEESDVTAD